MRHSAGAWSGKTSEVPALPEGVPDYMAADPTPIVPIVVFETNKLLAPAGIEERMDPILALYGKVLPAQKVIVGVTPLVNSGVEQAKLTGDLRVASPCDANTGNEKDPRLINGSQRSVFIPSGILSVHVDEDIVPGVIKGPQKRTEGLVILMSHDEICMLASSKHDFVLNHDSSITNRHIFVTVH